MNENTLILTEHRLPRLFDAALTLVAWGGFLFFLYARLWMQLTEESDHRWSVIIASFNTVLLYLLFAALNGWLLILWYQYNRRGPTRGGVSRAIFTRRSWPAALMSHRRSSPR
jgi:biofilm PGA synthesis protein PgaD